MEAEVTKEVAGMTLIPGIVVGIAALVLTQNPAIGIVMALVFSFGIREITVKQETQEAV